MKQEELQDELETEDIETIMNMLTGAELPHGVSMPPQAPHLDRETAFSVIRFLQEIVRIIPDNFEMCKNCGNIYNTDCGGTTTSADEYIGSWYEDCGIMLAEVEVHEGSNFCDPACEIATLLGRSNKPSTS